MRALDGGRRSRRAPVTVPVTLGTARGTALGTARAAVLGALALLVVGVGACSDASRSRCERICTREAGCAEELRVENDRLECIEACVMLEREPATRTLIMAHVACVDEAAGCAQVMACD